MNNVMERTATGYAVIDAAGNKASDCRGMLKSLVDAMNGITGPQTGLLGCLVVSIAGVAGYGIYAICDLIKSGHPIELTFGGVRFAANTEALCEASSL